MDKINYIVFSILDEDIRASIPGKRKAKEEVLNFILKEKNLLYEDLCNKTRRGNIVWARFEYWYLYYTINLNTKNYKSMTTLGNEFNRTYSDVSQGIKKVKQRIETQKSYAEYINKIVKHLKSL